MNKRLLWTFSLFVVFFCLASVAISVFAASAVYAQQDKEIRTQSIQLSDNGDAEWIIEIRKPLETDSEEKDFLFYIEQINKENNTQQYDIFKNQFSNVISSADAEYERDMQFESLSLTARIESTTNGKVGISEVRFIWENYAEEKDNGIEIGEILSDGYTLSDSEQLIVYPPENHRISDKSSYGDGQVTDDEAVEWFGPYSFNNIQVKYVHEDNYVSEEEDNNTYLYFVPPVVLIIIILFYVLYRRYYKDSEEESEEENRSKKTRTNSHRLKSDQESIVEFVMENGGRVKQKEITNSLDWSKSKISRVTNKMEDKNLLSKLKIGRENVVKLNEDKIPEYLNEE